MRRSPTSLWLTVIGGTGMAAFALGNMHYAMTRAEVLVKVLTVWAGLMLACLNLYWLSMKGPRA